MGYPRRPYRGDGEKDRKKKKKSKTRHPEFHAKILRFFEIAIQGVSKVRSDFFFA